KNIRDSWRELRNILTHNYSVVPDEKNYVQLVKKLDKINIYINGETERVITSMNDCIRLITDFESFFNLVFDKLLNIENE
ncbi:hypothetical protein, partial [Peribacillus frigoritolerans]|uniref:hypothetical protein n=1 Tax=Peribacillus frigoritolerans TaxID=450367 RepID=UPI00227EFF10